MTRDVHVVYLSAAALLLLVVLSSFTGCTGQTPSPQPVVTTTTAITAVPTEPQEVLPTAAATAQTVAAGEKQKIILATTTSLYDTGLLNYLEPKFEARYNVDLLITSQGTGKAIELAKRGDADILMVHSPSQEMTFLEGGNGLNRRTFAYNYFIIVGPSADPAGIRGMTPENAFKTIMAKGKGGDRNVVFVSRGDASGTHTAEQNIWKAAGYNYTKDVQNTGIWYIEAGKGMGDTLQMASQKGAYTLTDEGTFLAYKNNLNLEPIVSQGAILMNIYSVMAVYTDKQPVEKIRMADNFVNFIISPETMADIGNFGTDKYGKALFTPMTKGVPSGIVADFSTPAVAVKPLKVYHAGSLSSSFAKIKKVYETAHPDTEVQLWSGGSGSIIDKVTKQNMYADVLASADTVLIPKNMYPKNASFDVDFAKNSMVLCYTNKSREAASVTADNWYKVLAMDGVKYAISDPTSDPAGYRSLMTIALAERKYGDSTIFATLVAPYSKLTMKTEGVTRTVDATNPSPDGKKLVITKTGPEIVPLLVAGTVDYAFEYSSVAIQGNVSYISLPAEIDLSDLSMMSRYQEAKVIRPSGSGTVTESGTPIIYGVTVPGSAKNKAGGADFVNILIGSEGQGILQADGQTPIVPAIAAGSGIPDAILQNVKKV
jgi:tungstate transport system substrate-binding protein